MRKFGKRKGTHRNFSCSFFSINIIFLDWPKKIIIRKELQENKSTRIWETRNPPKKI